MERAILSSSETCQANITTYGLSYFVSCEKQAYHGGDHVRTLAALDGTKFRIVWK